MRGAQALLLASAVLCGALVESLVRGPTYMDPPKSMAQSSSVIGHLKGMVDSYIEKYDEEDSRFIDSMKAMDHVIQHAMDAEAKEGAVDEKLKMKAAHENKLQEITGMIRTLDGACGTLHKGSGAWLDKFPDEKAKVDAIYEANPASLLAKASRVSKAASEVSALARAQGLLDRAGAYLTYLGGPPEEGAAVLPGGVGPKGGAAAAPVKR